ncbi:hypothetical protein AMV201 [Betaentomopoxvirus amoorei]|uniref:AMV201 n=1 Tax=Amsacta moorei entomopoxvirus TaxID=28321 RepID=Q9EMK5_AMEPV|nr:hypothetical protein AMV201 [Amsacta moorei entomopoxvirus]AAG02907.1 AMV201 [Amsacta moorei entomopoxvirus]
MDSNVIEIKKEEVKLINYANFSTFKIEEPHYDIPKNNKSIYSTPVKIINNIEETIHAEDCISEDITTYNINDDNENIYNPTTIPKVKKKVNIILNIIFAIIFIIVLLIMSLITFKLILW